RNRNALKKGPRSRGPFFVYCYGLSLHLVPPRPALSPIRTVLVSQSRGATVFPVAVSAPKKCTTARSCTRKPSPVLLLTVSPPRLESTELSLTRMPVEWLPATFTPPLRYPSEFSTISMPPAAPNTVLSPPLLATEAPLSLMVTVSISAWLVPAT